MSTPLVEVVRSALVDGIHRGDLAVVDADGRMVAAVGEPRHKIAFWRSAAKPFQALPIIYTGAAENRGLTSEDLALIAGSHSGEQVHIERASAVLGRIGGSIDDLACGTHLPLDPLAAAAVQRAGIATTALYSNCSGNHLGMLALADRLGAGRPGYRAATHPAQIEILSCLSRFTGLPTDAIVLGVDGCGVPCHGTSVYHLALAFARLMRPAGLTEQDGAAAQTIRQAMVGNPYLVAGRDRLDTDLMGVGAGAIVAKGGAAGVQCVGLEGGVGLAVKIEDAGDMSPGRPTAVATLSALHQLGVLDAAQLSGLAAHARPALRTVDGDSVGDAHPVFTLDTARDGSEAPT